MDRSNPPHIEPQYDTRPISAKDVLALLSHGEVPGVNYEDPRIQEIRSCVLGPLGRVAMTEALKAGYMTDGGSAIQESRKHVLTAWRWWCTAAGHPHIVLSPAGDDLHQVSCDLISAGKRWSPIDVPKYPVILGEVAHVYSPDYRFAVSDRVLEVGGLEMDDAITIARNLVEYTTTGQFKQRPPAPEPDSVRIPMRPLLPMERSDGG